MYIPKFKQTKPLYTPGREYVYKDTNEEYIGTYIKTSKNRYYVANAVGKAGYELVAISQGKPLEKQVTPIHYDMLHGNKNITDMRSTDRLPDHKPEVAVYDVVRFFAKHKAKGYIQEISVQTYEELTGRSSTYHWPSYDTVKLNWTTGPQVGDIRKGSYIIEGAESKNRKAVLAADKIMPGIAQFLSDYRELI